MHLCEVDDEEEVQQPKRQGGACLPPHLVRVIGSLTEPQGLYRTGVSVKVGAIGHIARAKASG